jgi:hypothetical protein
VLSVLVDAHRASAEADRDYFSEVHCLQHLGNATAAAEALKELLEGKAIGN